MPKSEPKKNDTSKTPLLRAVMLQAKLEKLKSKALKGDLKAIEAEYLNYIGDITDDFYEALINHLILKEKWGKTENKILDILDYLYRVDLKYRTFLLRASTENKYQFSSTIIKRFTKANPRLSHSFQECQLSLLFKIFSEKKLPLFIKLLEHGACAQTWGLQNYDDPEPLESLFYSIIHYGSYQDPERLEYLKELMPYIPDVNQALTSEAKKNGVSRHYKPPITILCSEPSVEGLNLILPRTCLSHIAFQIICLSQTFKVEVRLTDRYAIATDREISPYNLSLYTPPSALPKQYNYTSYTLFSPSPSLDRETLEMCYQKMHLLKEAASGKLKDLSLEDFDREYMALFPMTQKNVEDNALYMLSGCEYLLMSYAKLKFTVPSVEQETFLKERAVPLYNGIIAVLEAHPNVHSQQELLKLYRKVKASFEGPQLEEAPPPVIMHPQAPASPKAQPEHAPIPQTEKPISTFERKGPN